MGPQFTSKYFVSHEAISKREQINNHTIVNKDPKIIWNSEK